MRGTLKGKTTLLVTHQVDFLHNVDQILVSLLCSCSYASSVVIFNLIGRVILKLMYVLAKGDEGRYDNPIRKVR